MESGKTQLPALPLGARLRAARGQGSNGGSDIARSTKPPMRRNRALVIAQPGRMGSPMTLFESLGKAPDPSALAGFVPCPLEDDVARLLLRPLFDDERESLLLAAFDAFERLVRLERIDGDTSGR